MQTMPGLGAKPAAASIDIDDDGDTVGCSSVIREADYAVTPTAASALRAQALSLATHVGHARTAASRIDG